VLATLDGDEITAGLPVVEVRVVRRRRWVALPFTDTCPALLGAAADAASFTRALEAARVLAGCPLLVRAPLAGDARRAPEAVTHELVLGGDPDAVIAGFHHSQRRNIKRAVRAGVEVRRADAPGDLSRTFYALHTATRRRLGVPVQPRRFFEAQWQQLVEPGLARLLLAYADGAAVAGMLLLLGNRTVTYKYGASDAAAWGVRPNHALFAQAISDACSDGNHVFDFGRTDFEDRGLRDFKSSWGAVETPLVYSSLGALRARQDSSAHSSSRLRRALLRRSPAWVCRAAGELFYRYAA
jgi:CelD/BcsL family acetyltransferase involved in cellulose biosynthesis